MYTLFIDTHFKDVLICLFKNDMLIVKKVEIDVKNTSEIVMPLIEECLQIANIELKDLNKIAVCIGPGSFTGVRLGVTIAKTMAYLLNIDIVCLTSLDLIGLNLDSASYVAVREYNGVFIAFFDETSKDIKYLSNSDYKEFIKDKTVVDNIDMDYEKLYLFIEKQVPVKAHDVNPLYIKSIEVLNDKKN